MPQLESCGQHLKEKYHRHNNAYFKNYKVLEGIKWRSMLFNEKTMLVKLLTNLTFIILLNIFFKPKCNIRTLNHSSSSLLLQG